MVLASLATALLQAAAAIIVIVAIGRVLLRPLFRLVASTRSTELFIAAVLFVIVADGVIAQQARLSMALGAFVAGLLLFERADGFPPAAETTPKKKAKSKSETKTKSKAKTGTPGDTTAPAGNPPAAPKQQ